MNVVIRNGHLPVFVFTEEVKQRITGEDWMGRNGSTIENKIEAVVEPFCRAENFEFVHLELAGGRNEMVVRIFLDKPGGINLDDCVYASRQLGDLIDVHVEELNSYRLEVSSPGLNRPLKKKKDYERFAGEKVKIETEEAIDGRKKFTGILDEINADSVVIKVDGNRIEISDHLIRKANLAGR